MKRGFLFGLGSFLVFTVLEQLDEAYRGECGVSVDDKCLASATVMTALYAPLAVVVIWRAIAAPPNLSRQHTLGGWLIGFCVLPVVWLILLITAVLVS